MSSRAAAEKALGRRADLRLTVAIQSDYCLARISLPFFSISARASFDVILPEKTACRSGVTTLSLISCPPGPSCQGWAYAPDFRNGSRSGNLLSQSDSSDLRDGIARPSDVHFCMPCGPVR